MKLIEKLGITPGQWVLNNTWVENMSRCQIYELFSENGISIIDSSNTDGNWEATKSDARLIAAAPEMLEALVELAEWYTSVTGLPAVKANRSIHKATGRTWREIKELMDE